MAHLRMIDSDKTVTASTARAVLTVAKQQGLDGFAQVAGGGTIAREYVWQMMWKWILDIPGDDLIDPLFAFRIRQEFGVDGRKKARKSPKKPRRRPEPQPWPTQ